jgi:hypothetical protein
MLFSFVDENLPMVAVNETALSQTSRKRYRNLSGLRTECLEFIVVFWKRNVAPLGRTESLITFSLFVVTGHM